MGFLNRGVTGFRGAAQMPAQFGAEVFLVDPDRRVVCANWEPC